jgi:putative SOS response-associated peptidase YedK
MRWGLVPWWAKDIKVGVSTFNARADTLSTKARIPRRLEEGPALPCGDERLL